MRSTLTACCCLGLALLGHREARAEPEASRPEHAAGEERFWAFVPPVEPQIPDVEDASWPQSPLDHFILAGLEKHGLRPAPPADRRTLARRLSFDLLGLPPDPAELEQFLGDATPQALATFVDRLLASPRHGERWGRHWLDVARYADSNGMDENLAYANAHRYRDYVIASINADKPYDQFVHEQLAGDLLPPTTDTALRNARLVATGFLTLGPKMLAEDDPMKMEMDIVDEQLDTTTRTFLGLTLGCARCHDHKYDPFSLQDYYGLAGIFKSTQTMNNFKVVAQWHERPLASEEVIARQRALGVEAAARRSEVDARIARARDEILAEAKTLAPAYARAAAGLQARDRWLAKLKPRCAPEKSDATTRVIEAEDYVRGNVKRDFTDYGNAIGVIYNQGELPNVAEYDVTLADAGSYQLDLRYAAAEARPVQLLVNGKLVRAGAAGNATGSWTQESQTWEVIEVVSLAAGLNTLRLERDGPFPHFDKLALTRLEMGVGGSSESGEQQTDTASGIKPELLQRWLQHLKKNQSSPTGITGEAFVAFIMDPQGPLATAPAVESYLAPEEVAAIHELRQAAERLLASAPLLPEAMAVADGKAQDLRIHVRGSHWELGETVPRRWPQALSGDRNLELASASSSGRLELAQWITAPGHALASRVIVNRLWRWHLGEGLVRTPDNFGRLGERPTHPELLDWLALRLIEGEWSLKSLHRLIVLSATYQMSSRPDPVAAEQDPENRRWWHVPRRRLEAEAIRDALLASSGSLDLAMGGTHLAARNREYVASTASSNNTNYASPRRSVYLPVIRSALHEMFQAFDFADPSTPNGDRDTTTVAPQALFLMNSDLVRTESKKLATHLLAMVADEPSRLAQTYLLTLGRTPADFEIEAAQEFFTSYANALASETSRPGQDPDPGTADVKTWAALVRALWSASEFSHVD